MSAAETSPSSDKLQLWRLFILGRTVVTGVFMLVLFSVNAWTVPAMLKPLFMVAGLQFAINAAYFYFWRQRDVNFMGYLCFILEIILITLLILFFGPGGHVFILAYLWPIIMGGWLLGARALLSFTLFSTISYALLFFLSRQGIQFLVGVNVTEITYQAFTLSLPYLAFVALLSWLLTKEAQKREADLRCQYMALQEANALLRSLFRASEEIMGCLHIEELAASAIRQVIEITGQDTVAFYARQSGHLTLVQKSNTHTFWPKTQRTPVMVKRLETFNAESTLPWQATAPSPESPQNAPESAQPVMIQLALRSPRGLEGVLSVLSSSDRALDGGQVHILQILGHQLGIALENVRLFQDLQSERNWLQAILTHMSEAVIVVDEHRILLSNRAAEHMLGLREGQPLPAWFTAALKQNRRAAEGQGFLFLEHNGRAISLSASQLETFEQRSVCTLYVARDITDQVQAERVKSDFVAYTSHELRTPLTTIKMILPLLLMDTPRESKSYEYLKIIETQVERQRRLINNVLDLARLEAGRYALPPEIVDPREVIEAALRVCRPLAEERRIDLSIEQMRLPSSFVSNSGGLEQVLINLLSNAIKFTDPGGRVMVSCTQIDQELVFAVQDTGIGMSEEEQKRIFEKFYTVHNPRKRGEGTGLGLVISKMIVQELGGYIRVTSEVGKGSRFSVHLPLEMPRREPSPAR
ncbi:MAG: PAS domain-containing protein [Chloroflexi bacterium]|nr:PAS domain-containing protein [Chloroflexota bacterium]